jgi:hypothetical protein
MFSLFIVHWTVVPEYQLKTIALGKYWILSIVLGLSRHPKPNKNYPLVTTHYKYMQD